MLERTLAKDFGEIFRDYPILIPNNRTAGWPDRGVQIKSRIVWFELKIVQEKYGATTILVNELTNAQAAWLAKWQYNGGQCFLFIGLIDYQEQFSKYAILKCGNWHSWPKIPNNRVRIDQLALFTDKYEVLKWFQSQVT